MSIDVMAIRVGIFVLICYPHNPKYATHIFADDSFVDVTTGTHGIERMEG